MNFLVCINEDNKVTASELGTSARSQRKAFQMSLILYNGFPFILRPLLHSDGITKREEISRFVFPCSCGDLNIYRLTDPFFEEQVFIPQSYTGDVSLMIAFISKGKYNIRSMIYVLHVMLGVNNQNFEMCS